MLRITLPATDDLPAAELQLEHSLVSLSKWESIYEKAFFSRDAKTEEETRAYVEHMLLSPMPPQFVSRMTNELIIECNNYINSRQSATWFQDPPNEPQSREVITSELIYYWLIQFQIPFQCETWHVNRLMTLVKICGIKQAKPKKMSKSAMAEQYRRLNAQRREQLGTSG